MSQDGVAGLDPTDQLGRLDELTTNDVPTAQRLSFWRDGVLKRMEPVEGPGDGQPFQARLRRIAVEGAGMMIFEIARDCGFREMPTFTRMFRRRYGMTPREARTTSGGAL